MLLSRFVADGHQTLAFTRSRKGAELVASHARGALAQACGDDASPVPAVAATLVRRSRPVVRLALANDGHEDVVFTLTPNDYAGHPQTARVATGHPKTVNWPTDADGYYDVTVTADTGDGFTRRYAGRIA